MDQLPNRNLMVEELTMNNKEKKLELKDSTIYQTNENCQVFNGPISGCVFAMPGATVNQSPVQKVDTAKQEKLQQHVFDIAKRDEVLFHFVHPEIEDEEAWRIHDAVKRLVAYQRIPEICAYLKELKLKGKVMLPPIPSIMYTELVRLGMPTGDGFSEKHFNNSYLK